MRLTKHKVVYWIIAVISLSVVSIWYVPKHPWRAVAWDGYGDTDEHMGARLITWKSVSDGAIVNEAVWTYDSSEDARKGVQKMLEDPKAVASGPGNNESSSENPERAVLFYEGSE